MSIKIMSSLRVTSCSDLKRRESQFNHMFSRLKIALPMDIGELLPFFSFSFPKFKVLCKTIIIKSYDLELRAFYYSIEI